MSHQTIFSKYTSIILFVVLFWVVAQPVAMAQDAGEKEVVAMGLGRTEDAARREAHRNAVQNVVGAMVMAETIVENDALVRDKILSHSDGYVSKSKQIGKARPAGDGLIEVTMQVTVKTGNLREKLKDEKITLADFGGEALFKLAFEEMERREQIGKTLKRLLAPIPASLLVADADVSKLKSQFAGNAVRITIPVSIRVDEKSYQTLVETLKKLLMEQGYKSAQVEISFSKEGELYTQGLWKKTGLAQKTENGEDLYLFGLCELVQPEKRMSRWSVFALPKYAIEGFRHPSAVEGKAALLDQSDQAIAATTFFMGDKDYAMIIQSPTYGLGPLTALVAPCFNIYSKKLFIRSPLNISPQAKEVTFTVTEQELQRITGARCKIQNRN